ncbi:integral membrane protein [Moniliophthora roreri]|nr:integral membrane protein [Moniliophthora roreri]
MIPFSNASVAFLLKCCSSLPCWSRKRPRFDLGWSFQGHFTHRFSDFPWFNRHSTPCPQLCYCAWWSHFLQGHIEWKVIPFHATRKRGAMQDSELPLFELLL